MKFTRIEDESKIGAAFRRVFSFVTRGTKSQWAVVGYHSGNVRCRVAWNGKYGLWVMRTPRGWDRHLLIFGTQDPNNHRSSSLNITCQINISRSSSGRQRAGAVLSKGSSMYLGHNGGIGGGKEGIGKAAFLRWYQQRTVGPVDVTDKDGQTTPYIVVGRIVNSSRFLTALAQFVYAVERFKRERDEHESFDHHLKRDAEKADEEGAFQPRNTTEDRDKVVREINLRRGQPDFRRKLLKAYGGRCAISDCDCPDALEAAHIRRYGGEETNHIQNGLLLRCDLHTLFDIGRIGVDPNTYQVVIGDELLDTAYRSIKGRKLRLPKNPAHHPNPDVLREHSRNWRLQA